MRTIGRLPPSRAFLRTNRVCGSGPSEASTRSRTPFDHRQDALDLGAEVPVAGRVDDVDDHVPVADRRVLGEDRDAPLLLELARVHDELLDVLADAERPALLQEGVDQRRLAVVHVRDDGDRPAVGAGGGRGFEAFGFHGRTAEPITTRLRPPLPGE